MTEETGRTTLEEADGTEILTYAILHVKPDQEGMPRAQVIDHVQIPVNRDEETGDVIYSTRASQAIYRHADAMEAAKVPQDGTYITVALDADTALFNVETVRKITRKYHD